MAHRIPVPPVRPLVRGHSSASDQGRADDDIIIIEDSDCDSGSDTEYYTQAIPSRKESSRIDTTYHCWKLAKAPAKGKDALSWKRADRILMSLPSHELAKQVRRQSKISPLLDTYERISSDQRQHVEVLIKEKQRDEVDHRAEWELAGIHRETANNMKTMVRETRFIRIILVRRDKRKEGIKAAAPKSITDTGSDVFDLNDRASLLSLEVGGSRKDRSVRYSRPRYNSSRSSDYMPERAKETECTSDKVKGKDKDKDFSHASIKEYVPLASKQDYFEKNQAHWTPQAHHPVQIPKGQPQEPQFPPKPVHQPAQAQVLPHNHHYIQPQQMTTHFPAANPVHGQPVSQQPAQVQTPGHQYSTAALPNQRHVQQSGGNQYASPGFPTQAHIQQAWSQQPIPATNQQQPQIRYAGLQQQQQQQTPQPLQTHLQTQQPQQPQQPNSKPDPPPGHPPTVMPPQQQRAENFNASQPWAQPVMSRPTEGNATQPPLQRTFDPLHTQKLQNMTVGLGQQHQHPAPTNQTAQTRMFDNLQTTNATSAAGTPSASQPQANIDHFGLANGGTQVHRTFADANEVQDKTSGPAKEQYSRAAFATGQSNVHHQQPTPVMESLKYTSLKQEQQQRQDDERRLQEKVMSWARQAQANPSRSSSSLEDELSTPPTSLSGGGYPIHRKPQAPVHRSSSGQIPRHHGSHERVDIYPARSGQRITPQNQFNSAHDRRRQDRPIIVHRHTDNSARNTTRTKNESWSCSSDDENDANYTLSASASRHGQRPRRYDGHHDPAFPESSRRGGSDRSNRDAASVMAEVVSKLDKRLQDMEDKEAEKLERDRLERERKEAYDRGVEDGLTWKKSRPGGFLA